jgi:hypothetical protein
MDGSFSFGAVPSHNRTVAGLPDIATRLVSLPQQADLDG